MLRTFRAWTFAAVLLGSGLPIAAPAGPACAADGPSAVLVVDTGSDELRYCVALGDDEVSGIELIALASEQHGLDYRLGYGGDAVCMLAGVGTEGDDCFDDYPNFWAYWRGDGSGGWSYSGTGAGDTSVADGDVEGWSWGTGNDGESHQKPPATTATSVCGGTDDGTAGAQSRQRDRSGASGDRDDGGSSSTGDQEDLYNDVNENDDGQRVSGDGRSKGRDGRGTRDRKKDGRQEQPLSDRASSMDEAARGDTAPADDGTPASADEDAAPWLGVAGLAVAAAFVALGFAFDRRRRRA